MTSFRFVRSLAAGAVLLLGTLGAQAQDFPTRPVTWVVPYTPGGITDTRARMIGVEFGKALGQTVLIENRPGAGGTIGTAAVARADPDGYTVIYGTLGTLAAAPSLYKNLPYDAAKDFSAVHMMANSTLTVVANPDRPYNNLVELVAYAKEHPGEVTVGLAGIGTMTHLASELFMNATGIELLKVPYQGSSPAMTDLIAGRLDIAFDYQVSTQGHFDTGGVKVLGVTGTERMQSFPDAQTMTEAGYPDATAGSWSGLFAPKGTPPEVLKKLTDAFDTAMHSEPVQAEMAKSGSAFMDMDGAGMDAFVAQEVGVWTKVLAEAGLTKK